MDDKKQLNVRIPIELYNQLAHGDKPQVETVIEAIQAYFKKKLNTSFVDSSILAFANESEFRNWFVNNFSLLGFDRIIEQSTSSFPDFILEHNSKEIRVELETLSSNFIRHGHDPSHVDLVICLKIDKELPVPIIELPFRFDSKTINITIRIDDELGRRIETLRGDKTKAEYYRDIIVRYNEKKLREDVSPETVNNDESLTRELADLKDELTHKEQIIKIMDGRVKDLQTQNGFLISEFQNLSRMNEKLLLPAPAPSTWPWWQFWKRRKER